MTTKNPTPSAISRLLGTKYTRGVNKLRGGNAGFLVRGRRAAGVGIGAIHSRPTK